MDKVTEDGRRQETEETQRETTRETLQEMDKVTEDERRQETAETTKAEANDKANQAVCSIMLYLSILQCINFDG